MLRMLEAKRLADLHFTLQEGFDGFFAGPQLGHYGKLA
jgi:hypothetical protein